MKLNSSTHSCSVHDAMERTASRYIIIQCGGYYSRDIKVFLWKGNDLFHVMILEKVHLRGEFWTESWKMSNYLSVISGRQEEDRQAFWAMGTECAKSGSGKMVCWIRGTRRSLYSWENECLGWAAGVRLRCGEILDICVCNGQCNSMVSNLFGTRDQLHGR